MKSLVEKFDQSANATSPTASPRYRPSRTTPASKSSTSLPHISTTSSLSRPAREVSYGSYKFNNLKPRERPQPAPASPTSLRKTNIGRQSLGSQGSGSTTGLSSGVSAQNLQPGSNRQPFFGEVIGDQDGALGPGYGIPGFAQRRRGSDSSVHPTNGVTTHSRSQSNIEDSYQSSLSTDIGVMPPDRTASAGGHRRSRSDITVSPSTSVSYKPLELNTPSSSHLTIGVNGQRRPSPPSKIPLPKRRPSNTSDSGSSIHSSSRAGSALGHAAYMPTSPIRESRPRFRTHVPRQRHKTPPPTTLSSKRYNSSPNKRPNSRNSLKAVIHAPPQQTSPRLRHSRDRQPVSIASTSASRARSTGRHVTAGRDQHTERPRARKDIGTGGLKIADRRALLEKASRENLKSVEKAEKQINKRSAKAVDHNHHKLHIGEDNAVSEAAEADLPEKSQSHESFPTERQSLTLNTLDLPKPNPEEPLTGTTEFENEESPVLGMPGGFAMTPPIQQSEYNEPALQVEEVNVADVSQSSTPGDSDDVLPPQTFLQLDEGHRTVLSEVMKLREQTPSNASHTDFGEDSPSEVDDSESIQIMLRDTPTINQNQQPWQAPTQTLQRISMGSQIWRVEPLDSSGNISFLEEEESPIDPFDNRSSVMPDDSVSVAFRSNRDEEWTPVIPSIPQNGHLTLDSEAYSTINRVLEHYHNSNFVTPEMAHGFREQVRAVSPALAQHKDWDSKEATETYLARLLSDANNTPESPAENTNIQEQEYEQRLGSLDIAGLDDSPDADYRGTAIIYTQPQRYSRGSATSSRWEGSSHDGQVDSEHNDHNYRPTPPPKDWRYSPAPNAVHTPTVHLPYEASEDNTPRLSRYDHPQLPEIETAGEGLGLAIQVAPPEGSPAFQNPPLPSHSPPPPPPPQPPTTDETPMYQRGMRSPPSPSVYSRNPPSSIFPSAPPPALPNVNTSQYATKLDDSPVLLAPQPVSALSQESPKERPVEEDTAETKRLKKRRHLVKELVDTESTFLQDMMVVEDIYKATSTSIDSIREDDRKVLFGNCAEIVEFSKDFLAVLKPAAASIYTLQKSNRWNFKRGSFSTSHSTATDQSTTTGTEPPKEEQDRKTSIGAAFGRNMARMEKVYGEYLKNHDAANQRLSALQDKPKVKVWLAECHNYAGDITQAWNLDSLLVKPTQRVLKYPLLISSLLENTPEDHPDYAALDSAHKELRAMSVRINESKKRAELLDQVVNRKRKESDGRLPAGLTKAFGRRTEKFKQQVGLSDSVDDQEYDAVAQKFGGHFFQLQIVMRDVEKYMDDVQSYVDQCNNQVAGLIEYLDVGQTPSLEIESQWRKYGQIMQELTAVALPEHKAAVRKCVIEPIMTLWKLHDQPQKMMQKRKKRIVEYARYKAIKDRGDKPDKKTQEAGEQWSALNETLKIELPQLYALTKKLVERCLLSLINIQITWQSTCERKLQSVLEKPPERTENFSDDMAKYVQRFLSDYDSVCSPIMSLGVCNKTLLTDISNFLSPAQTFVTDDASSYKKSSTFTSTKRTQSLSSDMSTPDVNQRLSGTFTWQNFDSTPPLDNQPQTSPIGRMRAESALSSRGPSTPRSTNATTPAISNFPPPRPSTGVGRTSEPSNIFPRLSLEMEQRSGSTLLAPSYSRSSGIFSSALPMSDSPTPTGTETPEEQNNDEPEVLFLAASLFEFNIAHDRREGGYPYLVYVPGEIFDVIGLKGELWLARNQDDASHTVGWIWEKHFARILPDES